MLNPYDEHQRLEVMLACCVKAVQSHFSHIATRDIIWPPRDLSVVPQRKLRQEPFGPLLREYRESPNFQLDPRNHALQIGQHPSCYLLLEVHLVSGEAIAHGIERCHDLIKSASHVRWKMPLRILIVEILQIFAKHVREKQRKHTRIADLNAPVISHKVPLADGVRIDHLYGVFDSQCPIEQLLSHGYFSRPSVTARLLMQLNLLAIAITHLSNRQRSRNDRKHARNERLIVPYERRNSLGDNLDRGKLAVILGNRNNTDDEKTYPYPRKSCSDVDRHEYPLKRAPGPATKLAADALQSEVIAATLPLGAP